MKKNKKYALNNSYFKNRGANMPDTILEIAKYNQTTGELPFEYNGQNWVYDAFCERQKRASIAYSQYLTPDKTAQRVAELAVEYFNGNDVLDACCGTGQLSKHLADKDFKVSGFDVDSNMVELCKILYKNDNFIGFSHDDYSLFSQENKVKYIVSNPPYEDLTNFFRFLVNALEYNGQCILIVPNGTWGKEKPKAFVELKNKFVLLEKEAMQEPFARTNVSAEILVLEKI